MSVFNDVAEFHEAGDNVPGTPLTPLSLLYRNLFAEEVAEVTTALVQFGESIQESADGELLVKDHVAYVNAVSELADGLIDTIYVAIGWLRAMGLDGAHLWKLVHAANMAKVGPDGKMIRNEAGKTIKPEGWVGPNAEIKQHVAKALGYTKRAVKDVDVFIAEQTKVQGKVAAELAQASTVERMFSVDEVAVICGVSRSLIAEEISSGRLRHKVFGAKTIRIPESALAEFQR